MVTPTPCHACPSPATHRGWCPDCLTLIRHWGAKRSTPVSLLVSLLTAYRTSPARPDGSCSSEMASAVTAITIQHYQLPVRRHRPIHRLLEWAKDVLHYGVQPVRWSYDAFLSRHPPTSGPVAT